MSSQQDSLRLPQDAAEETRIANYLVKHPDFFERHPGLLESVELSHATGATVSLIERQVNILRDKNTRIKQQLRELVDIARDNDQLSGMVHKLAILLLQAGSLAAALQSLSHHLSSSFPGDALAVLLAKERFKQPIGFQDYKIVRMLDNGETNSNHYSLLFNHGKPYCGRLRAEHMQTLFGIANSNLQSAAVIPLVDPNTPVSGYGLIAIASEKPSRFHADMGTVFLRYISELVSNAIARHNHE